QRREAIARLGVRGPQPQGGDQLLPGSVELAGGQVGPGAVQAARGPPVHQVVGGKDPGTRRHYRERDAEREPDAEPQLVAQRAQPTAHHASALRGGRPCSRTASPCRVTRKRTCPLVPAAITSASKRRPDKVPTTASLPRFWMVPVTAPERISACSCFAATI